MQDKKEVTMVKKAIHNPDDPRHFARVRETGNEVVASQENKNIARSEATLKLLEVGYDIYDPVYYFPREDVKMDMLKKTAKTTHCPLKGDTEYFDLEVDGKKTPDAAWSYTRPYNRSEMIRDYIAFESSKVQVTEYTIKD